MSKGMRVFFIQKACLSEFGNIKNIPSVLGREARNINPCVLSWGVCASSTFKHFEDSKHISFVDISFLKVNDAMIAVIIIIKAIIMFIFLPFFIYIIRINYT